MKNRLILLSFIFLAASAFIARASRPEVVPLREPLSGIPMKIGNWDGRQAPDLDSKVMAVLGVDDYVNRIYYSPDLSSVGLYVGYYQSQREGDTIHSPLNCLPGAGWNPMESGQITISVDGDRKIKINRIVIQKGMDRQLVLYWYQSHGRVIASEYWGKIYTVLDALRTNRTDAALVRIICPIPGRHPGAELSAENYATNFVKALFPILQQFLPS
jgi:EpsI family protein